VSLSVEQVLALAPDPASAKAGRELAAPHKWQKPGRLEQVLLWGEHQGGGKTPYRTAIDLGEMAFTCTCPSRKFPCKHGLGLLLLYTQQPALFSQAAPLPWAGEWLQKRNEKAAKKAEPPKTADEPADPRAAARRAEKREQRIEDGVENLRLWLEDLARQGLAHARAQPQAWWAEQARRLIDAQAPGLSLLVEKAAAACHSGDGWQDRLLLRLGRLQLLLRAYARLPQLPPELRAEVRSRVGMPEQAEARGKSLGDSWQVLGRRIEDDGRLQVQRTWLRGLSSGADALVLSFAPPGRPLDLSLPPLHRFSGEIEYHAAAWPQRAQVKQRDALAAAQPGPAGTTAEQALAAYAEACAISPWLEQFPLCLRGVPAAAADGWRLYTAGHSLPLSPRFARGWTLAALSGGSAIDLFGEWDGEHLLPLSAWSTDGSWSA
jgi:hypothetical protein